MFPFIFSMTGTCHKRWWTSIL